MTIDTIRIVHKCAGYAHFFLFFDFIFVSISVATANIYRIHIIQIHISCLDINQLLMLYAISVQVQFVQIRTKCRTMTNNDDDHDDDDDDDEYALHIHALEQVFYSKDSALSAMSYCLSVVDFDVCRSYRLACTFSTNHSDERLSERAKEQTRSLVKQSKLQFSREILCSIHWFGRSNFLRNRMAQ